MVQGNLWHEIHSRWKGKRYAIEDASRRMKGQPGLIIKHFGSRMIVSFEGQALRYREIREPERRPQP